MMLQRISSVGSRWAGSEGEAGSVHLWGLPVDDLRQPGPSILAITEGGRYKIWVDGVAPF
jgi:hypothetical protein